MTLVTLSHGRTRKSPGKSGDFCYTAITKNKTVIAKRTLIKMLIYISVSINNAFLHLSSKAC